MGMPRRDRGHEPLRTTSIRRHDHTLLGPEVLPDVAEERRFSVKIVHCTHRSVRRGSLSKAVFIPGTLKNPVLLLAHPLLDLMRQ